MKKYIVFVIIILLIGGFIAPSIIGVGKSNYHLVENNSKITSNKINPIDNETEYWALLVAVGVYADHPCEDRPSMLTDVEILHEMLLVSEHWTDTNIKLITAENATVFNIIKGLRWLDKMDDNDDISLVYITTHGYPLGIDIPPFDEDDRKDEALISYKGFKHPWKIIWDDLLNLFLSLLNSKGVCVIVDSCYAGGFNDPPYFKNSLKDERMNADEWMHGFAEDLSGGGRVVLMACREDEVSYLGFTPLLIDAFRGYADTNEDDSVSAEEAFDYVVENLNDPDVHPTIYDGYPGELQLTEVELPPTIPETPIGQIIGETNTTYNYSTVSIDPECDNISYGWDWDSDYIVDEWTDFIESNITVNISHSWNVEGTFNIRVKAKDERGVKSDWSNYTVVMMCDDNIPDQWQRETDSGCWLDYAWVAQSFAPSLDTLSKVDIAIMSLGHGDPKPLNLSIRDNLTGNNLTESSLAIPDLGGGKWSWYTFDFEDIDVITGETYYIVCKGRGDWSHKWRWKLGNPYVSGEAFNSWDGIEWNAYDADCSFVTWGK